MNFLRFLVLGISISIVSDAARAEIVINTGRNSSDRATAGFRFRDVPVPATNDAASSAEFSIVSGLRDRNGGGLEKLHDGRMPAGEDEPGENFFFAAGSDGGRLRVDLGKVIDILRVTTYSWHAGSRGPQVYTLYASDGTSADFNAEPKDSVNPEACGWKLLAAVDTRPGGREEGGQFGASITAATGTMGKYRYLLFAISRTEDQDAFGNTFFSEIDVVDASGPELIRTPEPPAIVKSYPSTDGKYEFSLDTTDASDLTDWADKELMPVVKEWYPKLVAMLPSDGFEAPTNVTIRFRNGMGGTPASAGGSRINCNIGWFRNNLKGEARGSVVHEMVHVVQQYGRARRNNPNATRTPGWLVEGIPDYIRWFLYEPETKGAVLTQRNIGRARYDASYRITGNFLDWVTSKYDREIVRKLNAMAREGKYTEQLWKDWTGHSVQELGEEWKKANEERLGITDASKPEPPAAK